jgi:hypothetical protein
MATSDIMLAFIDCLLWHYAYPLMNSMHAFERCNAAFNVFEVCNAYGLFDVCSVFDVFEVDDAKPLRDVQRVQ